MIPIAFESSTLNLCNVVIMEMIAYSVNISLSGKQWHANFVRFSLINVSVGGRSVKGGKDEAVNNVSFFFISLPVCF